MIPAIAVSIIVSLSLAADRRASDGAPSIVLESAVEAEAREYVLDQPIAVTTSVSFDIFVTPPMAPSGQAWQIRLDRVARDSNRNETIAKGRAGESGGWRVTAVAQGWYTVTVEDPASGIRQYVETEVDSRTGVVNVPIDLIPIRGEVVAGDEGVRGTIKLSHAGGASLKFTTDDRGRFDGHATREGKWRVEIMPEGASQIIRAGTVEIARRDYGAPSEIRIELPSGRLVGKVVNERGDPVQAFVYVMRSGRGLADAKTAPDGGFEVLGLEPGPIEVEAKTRNAESGVIQWSVENDGPELQLTVAGARKVRGWVRSPEGAPIAGALVRYFGGAIGDLRETSTNPGGGFSLTVPNNADSVMAVILVPMFPARITRLDVRPSAGDVEITLSRNVARLVLDVRRAPPWPAIRTSGGEFVSLGLLRLPEGAAPYPTVGRDGFHFYLEPGRYTICPRRETSTGCIARDLVAGEEVVVDARIWQQESSNP